MRPVRPSPVTRVRAKKLRRKSTFPERLLWSRLRARRLAGMKFRRQHPIGPFIVDFYCAAARLVIEIDGDSHHQRFEEDRRRRAFLERAELRVVRFSNDDVLQHLDAVLEMILRVARERA